MKNVTTTTTEGIKKLHIEATVLFAIEHIPTVDEVTLTKFLELVNATGNFGLISRDQLVQKMALIMKHIPGACEHSLSTLAELLDIQFPCRVNRQPFQPKNGKVVGVVPPAYDRASTQVAWQH